MTYLQILVFPEIIVIDQENLSEDESCEMRTHSHFFVFYKLLGIQVSEPLIYLYNIPYNITI